MPTAKKKPVDPEIKVKEILSTKTVGLSEDGVAFFGVAQPVLTERQFFDKLTKDELWEVQSGKITLPELMASREEIAIDESEDDLAAMRDFIRKYRNKVNSVDESRRILASKMLLEGKSPATVQELAGVNYSILTTWTSYKNARDKSVPLDEEVGQAIEAAKKAAEEAAKASA